MNCHSTFESKKGMATSCHPFKKIIKQLWPV